jgi:hypothetical protein
VTQGEIRNFAVKSKGTSEENIIVLLGEIAAQLAELNQNLAVFGNLTATYHNQFPVANTR